MASKVHAGRVFFVGCVECEAVPWGADDRDARVELLDIMHIDEDAAYDASEAHNERWHREEAGG